MQTITNTMVVEAKRVGLEVNTGKTKTMRVKLNDQTPVYLGANEVDRFVYLGSTMCADGDVRSEIGVRIGKAGCVKEWIRFGRVVAYHGKQS
jgi:hypothetical protein